jgi:Sulfotransferase family
VKRILIVGAPRSGTTWLAHALAATPGSRLVNEPDNRSFNPAASDSLQQYGGYPVLNRSQRVPEYALLWDPVFRRVNGRTPRRWVASRLGRDGGVAPPAAVVAKSVFAAFALDWLIDRYAPRIVVIERNPLDVVSSWMRLGFGIGDLATRQDVRTQYVERLGLPAWDQAAPRLLQVSWAVGLLMSALRHESRTRAALTVVSYETLSGDRSLVRDLAISVGLPWSDEAEAAARYPAEPQDYAREERRVVSDFLSQYPELAAWLEVESSAGEFAGSDPGR